MVKELANELRILIGDLPIFSKICGLVEPVTITRPNGDNTTVKTVVPITYDHNIKNCEGKEIEAIPKSSEKGILYFEEAGTAFVNKQRGENNYVTNLILVVWLNRELVNGNRYEHLSAKIITLLNSILVKPNPMNLGVFKRLVIKPARILQDKSVFSKYTYNETETQFLRPPFEYFAMQLQCNYALIDACIEQDYNFKEWACYQSKDDIITEEQGITIFTENTNKTIIENG